MCQNEGEKIRKPFLCIFYFYFFIFVKFFFFQSDRPLIFQQSMLHKLGAVVRVVVVVTVVTVVAVYAVAVV